MPRRAHSARYTFEPADPPTCALSLPVWKVLVARYAGAAPLGAGGALLDDFVAAFGLPRRDYAPVSRARATGLLREYVRFDPVYRRPRAEPGDVEAFLARLDESAQFFVDDDVAEAGIGVARAAWGLSVVGFDRAWVGGIWLADDD